MAHFTELAAGRAAFERREWDQAFEGLSMAAVEPEAEPGDLESCAEAARWSGRFDQMLDLLERAYRAYDRLDDRRGAARMALVLARENYLRFDEALAAGWLARAGRLLEREQESPEHGMLAFLTAQSLLLRGDFESGLEQAMRAAELGRRTGHRDVEALGLHARGRGLIASGRVADGLALIDEAGAMAMGGELGLDAAGTIYCGTIFACRTIGDWRRAAEWTSASLRWCARQSVQGFPGLCRFHRAEVLRLRGHLDEAERDVRTAIEELTRFEPRFAGWGYHELGEICRRRGDPQGAAEAFRRSAELGFDPEPGLSLLRLDDGRPESALRGLSGALADDSLSAREQRPVLLPAEITVALAAGRHELALAALAELERLAEAFGTGAVRAAAAGARGEVALAGGDVNAAVQELRRSWRRWCEVEAPYEAASARTWLARALLAAGDPDAAAVELEGARASFERLGALGASRRLEGLIESRAAGERVQRAFMFTDIVSSTKLVEALGDEAWQNVLGWHDRHLRELFAAHGGEEVHYRGDGFFVAFPEATSALRCAIEVQRSLARHRREHGFAPQVRIGLHAAEAARLGADYAGQGVHAAARIAEEAQAGEVLASRPAVEAAGEGFAVSDPRELSLKGLSAPAEVVTVAW